MATINVANIEGCLPSHYRHPQYQVLYMFAKNLKCKMSFNPALLRHGKRGPDSHYSSKHFHSNSFLVLIALECKDVCSVNALFTRVAKYDNG